MAALAAAEGAQQEAATRVAASEAAAAELRAALAAAARREAPPPPRLALSALPGCAVAEPLPAVPEGLHGLIRAALSAQPAHRGFFRAALAGAPLMHYATADGIDQGCAPPFLSKTTAA